MPKHLYIRTLKERKNLNTLHNHYRLMPTFSKEHSHEIEMILDFIIETKLLYYKLQKLRIAGILKDTQYYFLYGFVRTAYDIIEKIHKEGFENYYIDAFNRNIEEFYGVYDILL